MKKADSAQAYLSSVAEKGQLVTLSLHLAHLLLVQNYETAALVIITVFGLAFGHSVANASGPLFLSGTVVPPKLFASTKNRGRVNLLMQFRNDGNER